MALAITDYGFSWEPIQATSLNIPDNKYKPNRIMHEWKFYFIGTGDATAGNVSCPLDFGLGDKNHYYVITRFLYSSGVTSTTDIEINTDTDRWDLLYVPGHSINISIFLSTDIYLNPMNFVKPIYLGRPRIQDSDAGLCDIRIGLNTESLSYRGLLLGYTLERPLPLTNVLQP